MKNVLLTTSILFVFALLCPFVATATWTLEALDAQKSIVLDTRGSAIDSNGVPHVVYGDDHLYYAFRTGSAWKREIIDSAPGVGTGATIAIDAQNRVHVVYRDSANGRIKYAVKCDQGWSIQVIDVGTECSSIALDSGGTPYAVYGDGSGTLRFSARVRGSWHPNTVVYRPPQDSRRGPTFWGCSLAIDELGKGHVAFFSGTDVFYASNELGAWKIGTVSEHVSNDYRQADHTSIVVAPSGEIHIAYDSDSGDRIFSIPFIHYASNTGDGWTTETVGEGGKGGHWLAVSEDGQVRLAYLVSHQSHPSGIPVTTTDLMVASPEAGVWKSELARNVDGCYQFSIPRESRDGYPFFCRSQEKDAILLRFLSDASTGMDDVLIDSGGLTVAGTDAALDVSGALHVMYRNYANDTLNYATKKKGPWRNVTIADTVGPGRPRMSLDSSGTIHVIQNSSDGLLYGRKGVDDSSDEWIFEVVYPGDVLQEYAVAVDEVAGVVHVVFFVPNSELGQGLLYAQRTMAGSWEVEPTGLNALGDYAVALDKEGALHIIGRLTMQHGPEMYGLLHAAQTRSGVWNVEDLDHRIGDEVLEGDVDSIAVDSAGRLYFFAWTGDGERDLRFVTNRTGAWSATAVPGIEYSSNSYIAVAGDGVVHFVLQCAVGGRCYDTLTYGTYTSGVFEIENIENLGDISPAPPGVAISPSGAVHIVFSDRKTADILHMTNGQTNAELALFENHPPSQPKLILPVDRDSVQSTVTMAWISGTDPDGDPLRYELYLSQDEDFCGCAPFQIEPVGALTTNGSGVKLFGIASIIAGAVLANGVRRKTRVLVLTLFFFVLSFPLGLMSCGGGGTSGDTTGGSSDPPDHTITYKPNNLAPGTTYFWKVVADDGKGGRTQSEVWSFTTAQ